MKADSYHSLMRANTRRKLRLIFLLLPVVLSMGVTLYAIVSDQSLLDSLREFIRNTFSSDVLPVFALGSAILAGTFSYLIKYLQANESEETIAEISERIRKGNLGSSFNERLSKLEQRMATGNIEDVSLPTPSREELIEGLKQMLIDEGAWRVQKELKESLIEHIPIKDVGRAIEGIGYRLNREIQSLTKRGNLNLAIGVITTMIGLAALSYFVITHISDISSPASFLIYFVPRATLVLFIQVFAFFFLKLYKTSLDEIKFFQNEITNVEIIGVSLRIILDPNYKGIAPEVVANLSKVERNYIIAKGQTTIELERAKIEAKEMPRLIKALTEVLQRAEK